MTYLDFLEHKAATRPPDGIEVDPSLLHPSLFPHQRHVIEWAALTGRDAVFLDTGLGKSRILIEWGRVVSPDQPVLVVAPLSVARQTVREAAAIDVEASYVRSQDDVTGPGVWVTNYEMADRFKPGEFGAVVLDESSILKNHTGATRNALVHQWAGTPFRLACTATPAPNDVTELANHSEFLGAMSRVEMLASFFVHDQDGWRPKRHAMGPMYDWMATWAIAARRPSDLGPFDDALYELPPLRIHGEAIEYHDPPDGMLFATSLGGVGGRAKVRRATMDARLERAASLLDHDQPCIAWCGLNPEADLLSRMMPGAVNLHGSMAPDEKAEIIESFQDGGIRCLVTKIAIAGMGLNFQRAAHQVFVGIGDSYEGYYQAIRRSWRFGQTRPVDVHIVVSELERQIVHNVQRKEAEAAKMTAQLVTAMSRRAV